MATRDLESLRTDFPNRPIGKWKFSKHDWWFTLAMGPLLLLANHYGHKPSALLVIAIWLFMILPSNYGRIYAVFGRQLHGSWLRLRHRDPTAEVAIWSADERLLLRRPEPISLTIHSVDELGFIHGHNKDTIVVAAKGSDIPALGIEAQYDVHLAMAEVIRKAAALTHSRRGHNVGWGWVFRSRPLNMADLNRELKDYLSPQAWEPDALLRPEADWTRPDRRSIAYGLNVQEVQEVTQSYGRDVTMAAVCTVQGQEFERLLQDNQANRLPVIQLARALPEELAACGVIDPHALSPKEMHAFFRGALDVERIDDYYDWLATTPDAEILASDQHLPQERISAGQGYLRVDGSYTSVLWVMESPAQAYPHQIRQLYNLQAPWYTVSLVGGTTSTKGEYAWLDRVIALSQEIEDRARVVHRGPKQLARQESRIERQKKVFESRFGQDYNLFIALHHTDLQGLEDAVDGALQTLSLSNMTAQRVADPVWQLPFALCATMAIDMNML